MSSTKDPDEESEGDRRLANIVLAVGFVVLVGAGIWLANAMVTAKKADDCISHQAGAIASRSRSLRDDCEKKFEVKERLCRWGISR